MKEILTVEDLSELLGISRNTLQKIEWRKKTGCPLEKKGKRLYATKESFRRWFKNWN